ncbi:hypothetical protein BDK51DRAFT_33663 [Blyttiomyces helicus]|uniref:Uncharacterized protein n=1 Tax=Blyttiomyces helicus TaxID=388810 RepID=A0A4P9WHX9_9FUNG|nr:hypothetical protein BDK51DRAFT_33663 [Blyttiomyces helicus]|eukprot:RKO91575.1 hypothetical protein BDK51DRAFT_33663 [Blyttiomyces helicus]
MGREGYTFASRSRRLLGDIFLWLVVLTLAVQMRFERRDVAEFMEIADARRKRILGEIERYKKIVEDGGDVEGEEDEVVVVVESQAVDVVPEQSPSGSGVGTTAQPADTGKIVIY